MPVRNLYVGSSLDRKEIPGRVFATLLIANWEERDSDNYPEGSYYAGRGGDVEVTLWADEYWGFEDFPYCLALDLRPESAFDLDDVADLAIVELLKGGFTVARELRHEPGWVERELYALDQSARLVKQRDKREIPEE